ncbi:hypothetical protein GMC29_10055 [Streptococcus salivarius]|uniref:YopX family protein n=1 Tax=Streptococcus salivarius TaxID=1304 RepID=UPI0012BC35EC|nr:YopX family protein [Streptococcus salivarius]MTR26642.1 hypothetical protein [Streptococcus salivarius]
MIPRYRAWDKNLKTMYEVDDIMSIDFGKSEISVKTLFFERTNYYKFDDIVLMQSTGLKDENGKEIFEGDIVKVTDGDERTNFPDGGIGTICGLDGIFMWYIDGQVHNGLFDISQEYYIEVVGNIYENPELLEVSS